jgi:hypothetical protein
MQSIFVVLEKYHGFENYKVFGCNDLCSFENHGIAILLKL